MTVNNIYLTCVVWSGKKNFLLWRDNPDGQDDFLLDRNGVIFSCSNSDSALSKAKEQGVENILDGSRVFNLDEMWSCLKNIAADSYIDKKDCICILQGWNTMEYMASSLKIEIETLSDQTDLIDTLYDDIFEVSDVLDFEPSKTRLISSLEKALLIEFLKNLWVLICYRNHWDFI
ncbi:MAG: hypothetical protein NVSMB40_16020 [Aquirhabdus sp.]